MGWQVLLIISIVTYALSVILQRILLANNKTDPVALAIVFQLFTGLLIAIYAFINGFHLPNFSSNLHNFIYMIFLYTFSNILIFKSLKLIEASEFTILFSTRALWTVIAAVILLKETFSLQQSMGTLLIFASVIIVSFKSHKIKLGKGQVFAFLAAIFFGIAFVNDAFILKNNDVPSYLVFSFTLPGLFIWILNSRATNKMKFIFHKEAFLKIILLGFLYAISAISVFLAYKIGNNAAQIAPLNQTSTILTVILGVIILKENNYILRKIFGSIISFLGIILLK